MVEVQLLLSQISPVICGVKLTGPTSQQNSKSSNSLHIAVDSVETLDVHNSTDLIGCVSRLTSRKASLRLVKLFIVIRRQSQLEYKRGSSACTRDTMFVTIKGSSSDQYSSVTSAVVPAPPTAVPFTSTAAAAIASNRRIVVAAGEPKPQTLDERFRVLSAQRSQAVRREEAKSRQAEARQATLAAQRRTGKVTETKKEALSGKPAPKIQATKTSANTAKQANGKAAQKKPAASVKSRLTFPGQPASSAGSLKSRLSYPGGAPVMAAPNLAGLPTVFNAGRTGGIGLLPPPTTLIPQLPGVVQRPVRNRAALASAVFGLGARGAGRPAAAVKRGGAAGRGRQGRGGTGRGAAGGGGAGRGAAAGRGGGRQTRASAADLDQDLDDYMLQAHAEQ